MKPVIKFWSKKDQKCIYSPDNVCHKRKSKPNHSIENSITVSSIYTSMQDLNKTLQEVSQEPVPVSLNATFQGFPYPDPIPATFVTAIISYCPPNTST